MHFNDCFSRGFLLLILLTSATATPAGRLVTGICICSFALSFMSSADFFEEREFGWPPFSHSVCKDNDRSICLQGPSATIAELILQQRNDHDDQIRIR